MALPSYGHVPACTAGQRSTYVNDARVPDAHYEEPRSSLTEFLDQKWPNYVRETEVFQSFGN